MKTIIYKSLVLVVVSIALNARAGFFDELKSAVSSTNSASATTGSLSDLSQSQVADGLKQALGKGVKNAISNLGHDDGFLTNLDVKIPLPEKLQTVEKGLRLAGQGQLADDFIASMNHAAEQAVPVAADVFGDAIQGMTIDDAKNILAGPNDAATKFFERTTRTNLYTRFYPVVQKATDQVGVTAKYKQMMNNFTPSGSFGGLFGGSSSPVNFQAADIDGYVTDKALDGLFKMVAAEEKNIRQNPVARTTDLLQKVFGSTSQ